MELAEACTRFMATADLEAQPCSLTRSGCCQTCNEGIHHSKGPMNTMNAGLGCMTRASSSFVNDWATVDLQLLCVSRSKYECKRKENKVFLDSQRMFTAVMADTSAWNVRGKRFSFIPQKNQGVRTRTHAAKALPLIAPTTPPLPREEIPLVWG